MLFWLLHLLLFLIPPPKTPFGNSPPPFPLLFPPKVSLKRQLFQMLDPDILTIDKCSLSTGISLFGFKLSSTAVPPAPPPPPTGDENAKCQQSVVLGGASSSHTPLIQGISQERVFLPLLFMIHVNSGWSRTAFLHYVGKYLPPPCSVWHHQFMLRLSSPQNWLSNL